MIMGKVVAKKCPKCGHHEIGIEDKNRKYTQLKPGTNIIIGEIKETLQEMSELIYNKEREFFLRRDYESNHR